MKLLPQRLVEARLAKGWTVSYLEKATGIDHHYINRYEKGLVPVKDAHFRILIPFLDIPLPLACFLSGRPLPMEEAYLAFMEATANLNLPKSVLVDLERVLELPKDRQEVVMSVFKLFLDREEEAERLRRPPV